MRVFCDTNIPTDAIPVQTPAEFLATHFPA